MYNHCTVFVLARGTVSKKKLKWGEVVMVL